MDLRLRLAAPVILLAAFTARAQDASVASREDAATDAAPLRTAEDLEAAFRAVKRNDSYQYELAPPIPPREPSAFERWIGELFGAIFNFIAPILPYIFYLGLAALAAGAIYLLVRSVYETRFAKPSETVEATPDMPLYQPAQAQARILLEEVDRLAAEGRYGEAVHVLLFRSIQDIDRNRPNIVRRSLTAREIGALSVLTPQARTAFSTIAGVSELAHFGGVAVNKAGFETARAAYARMTGQPSDTPASNASRRRRR